MSTVQLVTGLLFANDDAIAAHTEITLQYITCYFAKTTELWKSVWRKLSSSNSLNLDNSITDLFIYIWHKKLKIVYDFIYLDVSYPLMPRWPTDWQNLSKSLLDIKNISWKRNLKRVKSPIFEVKTWVIYQCTTLHCLECFH